MIVFSRRATPARLLWLCGLMIGLSPIPVGAAEDRPNILWISFEDISPDLGCYGVDYADTPNLDRFATESVRYTRAWSNAGICAPARATLITGMYPPGTGAQNMRSEVPLPNFIRAFPEYLRRAGYFTSNHVKTDYNWRAPKETWSAQSADWREQGWRKRDNDQPFFTVINITDTHSSQLYWRGEERYRKRVAQLGTERLHDPDQAPVPPYYPDTPEVRGDLARYHDNITYADHLVGEILAQLEADGLADNTIVFYFSDHGRGMPRSKSWCFHSSLHVPFMIRFPERFASLAPVEAGQTEDRLVSFVDFAPTVLSLAGVEAPEYMDGDAFLGQFAGPPRQLAFAYRDRLDGRYDLIRSVWDGRYHLIRNYFPHLPWFHEQTRDYPHTQPTYQVLHQLAAQGELDGDQAIYMSHERPALMLFDTTVDPYELNNLADHPEHAATVRRLQRALHAWQDNIVDLGFMPESIWFERAVARGVRVSRHTQVRQDPQLYPLPRLRELADSLLTVTPATYEAIESDNLATRFWGTLSLLATDDTSEPAIAALTGRLEDPSITLRVLAIEALARQGREHSRLPELLEVVHHDQPFIALRAANAIDHLGEVARPLLPGVQRYLAGRKTANRKTEPLGSQFPEWILRRTAERLAASR